MSFIQWSIEAVRDRESIYDYVEQHNPEAALKLDELFSKAVGYLAAHPALGREGRVQNTRELVVHESYVLIYDIMDSHVRILRILHAAMLWP